MACAEVLAFILHYAVMNSAPACSPTLDSDDVDVDGKLSAEFSDIAEDTAAADQNIANGYASETDDGRKSSDSDSDDGCDGLVDGSPLHRLVTECQQSSSTALDLSRQGLHSFCRKLFKLSDLQVIR